MRIIYKPRGLPAAAATRRLFTVSWYGMTGYGAVKGLSLLLLLPLLLVLLFLAVLVLILILLFLPILLLALLLLAD